MIYCLSFNGYLHGVLTPGFPLGNQLGGSLYLQTPTTPVLEWTISARSSQAPPPPASAGGGGWFGGFSVVIRWWVVMVLGSGHGVVCFC